MINRNSYGPDAEKDKPDKPKPNEYVVAAHRRCCELDAGSPRNAVLSDADGLSECSHPVLLLRANNLILSARHLRIIEPKRQAARLSRQSLRSLDH